MAKQRSVVSVHIDIAALVWATRGLNSDAEWAIWGRSFVEALATQSPEKNQFAAQLIGDVIEFREKEAERIRNLRNVQVQTVQDDVQTESKKESKKESKSVSKKEITEEQSLFDFQASFDIARKAYPGVKAGLEPEFANFRKKHKAYREIIPLLLPAIEREKAHKAALHAAGQFVPQWKNFKTWINNTCWTNEFPKIEETHGINKPGPKPTRQEQLGAQARKLREMVRRIDGEGQGPDYQDVGGGEPSTPGRSGMAGRPCQRMPEALEGYPNDLLG